MRNPKKIQKRLLSHKFEFLTNEAFPSFLGGATEAQGDTECHGGFIPHTRSIIQERTCLRINGFLIFPIFLISLSLVMERICSHTAKLRCASPPSGGSILHGKKSFVFAG